MKLPSIQALPGVFEVISGQADPNVQQFSDNPMIAMKWGSFGTLLIWGLS